jgi:hypothetical protein
MDLYEAALGRGLRVLVYSGDVDICVPWPGTDRAVAALNQTMSDEWHPWYEAGQVAGYVVGYRSGQLQYATVKNAGHMVPSEDIGQPAAALALFSRFLAAQPL